MVHGAMNALSWGLPRLGLAIVALFLAIFVALASVVTVMVAIEAVKALGQ